MPIVPAAFVVDLDGTLIGRDEKISPPVALAMRRISELIPISIVSGRESSHVLQFARELGLTAPQVSDNGALILDPTTNDEVWSAPLNPGLAREIVAKLRRQGLAFIATYPGGSLTQTADIEHHVMTRISALDMREEVADAQISHFHSHPELNVVKVALPYNGTWAVDFTHVGIDKANAVRLLADRFAMDTSLIIAAGDSFNDVSLLKACGLRIAMGNAPNELKALADYVAPSVDDDGLAIAIEQFIIPKLSVIL